ncbi:alpha/beta hydrolase [Alkalibacillus almallahensis]|uniref:alpha/beta hydrolase n=1 Tax=Alkalibacillus almallahensis TaxID=1379154 RepID=UPI001421C447|nr:alpha/beta hydrolase [Alkalibacillus almallahensis]NIK13116.1 acetyl esterase/lipase [Alkalibacillus almallahensis]
MTRFRTPTVINIIFYSLLTSLFLGFLFLFIILDHRWFSYIILILSIAVITWGYKRFSIGKNVLIWIASIIVLMLTLVYGRPDLSVSFQGHFINETMKFNYFTEQRLSNERRTFNSVPYNFQSWDPPKTYENEQIQLSQSKGYLLSHNESSSDHVIYQLHGGAYINPFSNGYNETAVRYSNVYNDADVFSLDYRTAPEHEHPAALTDAKEGYRWLINQGYDANDIVVVGDSAGGGLALAMGLKLRDQDQPLPSMFILASPWTDLAANGDSYKTKIQDDALFGSPNPNTAPEFPVPVIYAGDHDLTDPYLSPAYGEYDHFAPILIQTGREELLLSDSQTIYEKAKAAGTTVQFIEYEGLFHNFYISHPEIPESQEAWKQIDSFIEKYQ